MQTPDYAFIQASFRLLSTPLIADACVRMGIPLRVAPTGIRPLIPGSHLAGRALPVKHYGSVDIFLEAMENAEPGDLLVIDNQGRLDEACIGDLTVLEAQAAGLAGIIVWGCHRDTAELVEIGFPVFSYGACPAGPTRLDPVLADALTSAQVGESLCERGDFVFADEDGVLFVEDSRAEEVLLAAQNIWEIERTQASDIKTGRTLREQLRFSDYLSRRKEDPGYTFRKHLRSVGGAVEE